MTGFDPDRFEVEISPLIEPGTITQVTVPLDSCERPEVELFEALASYFENHAERVMLVGLNVHYRQEPFPVLVALVVTGIPPQVL